MQVDSAFILIHDKESKNKTNWEKMTETSEYFLSVYMEYIFILRYMMFSVCFYCILLKENRKDIFTQPGWQFRFGVETKVWLHDLRWKLVNRDYSLQTKGTEILKLIRFI